MTHSDGPWHSDKRGNIATSKGWAICHWALKEDRDLITTSPDLLEALEEMADEYDAVRHGQGWHYPLESIRKARAAIAKARGLA